MTNFTFPTPSVPHYTPPNPVINAFTSIRPSVFTVRGKLSVKYRIELPFGTPVSHVISSPQINECCYGPHLAN